MYEDTVVSFSHPDKISITDPLTGVLRAGARRLLADAAEAEVEAFIGEHAELSDDGGRPRVVRHGYLPERSVQTGIGPGTVKVPKVRSRDGNPVSFRSALVPPYVRKSASLEAALPWLYLKGISTGEMAPALEVLVGSEAKGLSASTVSMIASDSGLSSIRNARRRGRLLT